MAKKTAKKPSENETGKSLKSIFENAAKSKKALRPRDFKNFLESNNRRMR